MLTAMGKVKCMIRILGTILHLDCESRLTMDDDDDDDDDDDASGTFFPTRLSIAILSSSAFPICAFPGLDKAVYRSSPCFQCPRSAILLCYFGLERIFESTAGRSILAQWFGSPRICVW